MLKFIFLFCTLIISTILFSFQTNAEPPSPPEPWYIEFSNGKIFYMTPEEYEMQGYPKSGLYYHDEMIYSVDRFYRSYEIYFANDGSSFVYMPYAGWDWVAVFVRGGREKRTYTFDDVLIRPEDISETTIGFIWDDWRLRQHDQLNNTLQVTTKEDRQIVFDLTTGQITVSYGNTVVWPVVFIVIVVSSIVIFIVIQLRKTIKDKKNKENV